MHRTLALFTLSLLQIYYAQGMESGANVLTIKNETSNAITFKICHRLSITKNDILEIPLLKGCLQLKHSSSITSRFTPAISLILKDKQEEIETYLESADFKKYKYVITNSTKGMIVLKKEKELNEQNSTAQPNNSWRN